MGKIIEVPNDKYITLPYAVGDVVVYKKDDVIEFNLNGKKYIAVDDDDMVAVIKEENE